MTSEPDPQPAVAAEAQVSTKAVAESPAPRGFLEWFWRGKSLKIARAYRTQLPRAEHVRLRHALAALELADRAYDPVEPLRTGSSLGLSISLYREAVYFALLAQNESFDGPDLATLFRELPQDLLEFAAGGAEELRAVKLALVERDFVQTAQLPQEALPGDAKVAHDFAHALVRKKLLPEARVGSLLLQRGARSFGLTALLAALLTFGVLTFQRLTLKPDLAEGKPWRASSALDICKPKEHYCASARTDIFFCTLEESNPWVEIDLGKPTDFSRLDVTNRSDCCGERAAPLVAEVSNDQKAWREVARRKDTFSEWSAKFAPQKARYVRLRAPRRTILHLEKVAVRVR
ncbi:MAG TPA: discoidin domain-containing protein [Polyangiaceae bacterium]|nr:discoidin domain-containing protein [Polyangiaceae bacterium]